MKVKKILSLFLVLAMTCALLCVPVCAADSSETFAFTLTSDADGTLQVGDVVTVTLTLSRTDKAEKWAMYAWQTMIAYDNTVFELVEGSVNAASGVGSSIHTIGGTGKVYFDDYSLSKSGDEYPAHLTAGSFKLRVIGGEGSYTVQNTNYLVSTAGGTDRYLASAQDVRLTVQGGSASGKFTDVEAGSWYEGAVSFVVNRGLFNGTGDGTTFEPGTAMSRAMVVTVLWRLDGQPAAPTGITFTDVVSGSWYDGAVQWASANKVVEGYGNGLFGTNDPVTREQLAVFLYRCAGLKGFDVSARADLSGYPDTGAVSGWASDAMAWAVAKGIITGTGAGTLNPTGTASRAEVATMLMRFVQMFCE